MIGTYYKDDKNLLFYIIPFSIQTFVPSFDQILNPCDIELGRLITAILHPGALHRLINVSHREILLISGIDENRSVPGPVKGLDVAKQPPD